MEKEIILLTITLGDPLGKFLLLFPTSLSSAGLEVLVPEQGVLLPKATANIPLNCISDFPLATLGFYRP